MHILKRIRRQWHLTQRNGLPIQGLSQPLYWPGWRSQSDKVSTFALLASTLALGTACGRSHWPRSLIELMPLFCTMHSLVLGTVKNGLEVSPLSHT